MCEWDSEELELVDFGFMDGRHGPGQTSTSQARGSRRSESSCYNVARNTTAIVPDSHC